MSKVDDEETNLQHVDTGCLAILLEVFKDVFKALPRRLPPWKEMTHTIPLKEGNELAFRPIYCLNLIKLEEAER